MTAAKWLPFVSTLKPTGEGRYEVRGTTTGILIGWVFRRSAAKWYGEVAVFKDNGLHETDQGKIVRRPLAGAHDTRQEAWAATEAAALRDALRPADELDA